jgi:hypothetical protein
VIAPRTGLVDTLDRLLILRSREVAAEALPDDRRADAARLHRRASARVDSAMGQRGPAALMLARSAIPLYLDAAFVARGAELGDEPPAGAWERYDALVDVGALPALPPNLALAREHALADLSPEDEHAEFGEARTDEALSLATFLGDAVEVSTPRAVRIERILRIAGAVLLCVLVAAATKRAGPKPQNHALHAAVTMSSHRAGFGPPGDLTNGKVAPEAGIATNDEPDPWVTIDLGAPVRVSDITLMGNDDHQEDQLPLRVETSGDGEKWDPATWHKTSFSVGAPAVMSFSSRTARFVRIHGRPGGALYLHEVEIE